MSLSAQKMITVTASPGTMIPIHTVLRHLSVIELESHIEKVAAESEAFQIEWRDKTVFVYAHEAGPATNLFVWTKQGKIVYELLPPTTDLSQLDVSIETHLPSPPTPVVAARPAERIPADLMLRARAVEWAGSHKVPKHVASLVVRDVCREEDHLYLRYQVDNNSSDSLSFDAPRITAVPATTLPASLPAGKIVQIGLDRTMALGEQGVETLPVLVEADLPRTLSAGQSGVGIVGVRLSPGSASSTALLIRLWLPVRGEAPLVATVVAR
jgi:hypothetical protein